MTTVHYRKEEYERAACRILSSFITTSADWEKVTCSKCKDSYGYEVYLDTNKLRR